MANDTPISSIAACRGKINAIQPGGVIGTELLAACRCEYAVLRPGRMVMRE